MSQTTRALPANLMTLLMPLADRTLILPQVSMAELVSYHPTRGAVSGPDWYLGQVEWRDLRLPLLSFEAASGSKPVIHDRCRVAVINALGEREHVKFLAVLLQGIPRSIRVEQNLESADVPLEPLELGAAKIGGEVVKVPDLAALEQLLEDEGLI
ncbi:chemotaxis protein CheW [Pseudomonas matsuisoli]|uniref:Chemotaxis protein n=1 Tax=Pseudomonas matsuisoli TaxID=1515666 RepID=A0A917Q077_9PSED|nr:chemotaxis protein CheW [Pseudomonas matsuisoli]GGK02886.1 chemotaxis protein [Pseudomonas matsuisoli]